MQTLEKRTEQPNTAWPVFSRALKVFNIKRLPNLSEYPHSDEVSWLASKFTVFVLQFYKYHQLHRRKDLARLCRLTAAIYLQASEQKDPNVQLRLAKQADVSRLLPTLRSKIGWMCEELIDSAKNAQRSAASAATATHARVEARSTAMAKKCRQRSYARSAA